MPILIVSHPEHIPSITAELKHESERAAGIVGAVLVDESLTTLIRSRFLYDEDILRELFRSAGPLGAFSVKINVGYLMGLFTAAAWKELDTIRRIRNEFAHYTGRSFSTSPILDLANTLSLSETVEFHAVRQNEQLILYIGTKPPADQQSETVLPPIAPADLTPRERYMRACHFYATGLSFTASSMPKNFQPCYF